jgi:hypothetical protein
MQMQIDGRSLDEGLEDAAAAADAGGYEDR